MTHLRVVSQNSSLDPIEIEKLARFMAEQTWVDMRVVPGGIAERVLIVGILIRREYEEVELEQWIEDESGDIQSHNHWVHAEEIWWAKPTQFERGDHLTRFEPKGERQSKDNAFDAAVAAVASYFRVTPAEVAAIAKDRLDSNHYRYWIMLVYRELVPKADATTVTGLFGYQSVQPLVSARQHATAPKSNGEERVRAMVSRARELLK